MKSLAVLFLLLAGNVSQAGVSCSVTTGNPDQPQAIRYIELGNVYETSKHILLEAKPEDGKYFSFEGNKEENRYSLSMVTPEGSSISSIGDFTKSNYISLATKSGDISTILSCLQK